MLEPSFVLLVYEHVTGCVYMGDARRSSQHTLSSLFHSICLIQSFSCSLSLCLPFIPAVSITHFLSLYRPLSHPYSPMYSIPGLSWPSLHPSLQRPVIMLRLTQRCSVQPSCCCLICSVGALIITHLLILGSVYRDCRHVGPRPDTHNSLTAQMWNNRLLQQWYNLF